MRIRVLRQHYCAKCPIVKRSPRSTGVKMLLEATKNPPKRVLDFGCSNWRNSTYLEKIGAWAVRMDSIPDTKPDVVAYPTHMPFRDRSFDAVLLTHILMFLEDKIHWPVALEEAARVARSHIVVETYKVKHPLALDYGVDELITQLAKWKIVRRNVRRDMQNFVISPAP